MTQYVNELNKLFDETLNGKFKSNEDRVKYYDDLSMLINKSINDDETLTRFEFRYLHKLYMAQIAYIFNRYEEE